jgi:hypothetical protein
MALAKRGTKLIVVDGEAYRWTVDPEDKPGLAILVERDEGSGQRMVTWVDHGTSVTPGLVAKVIRRGLDNGWTPRERAKQVTFRIEAAELAELAPSQPTRD